MPTCPAGHDTESTDFCDAGSRLRLRDGDHIYVGAWTRLTIRAR